MRIPPIAGGCPTVPGVQRVPSWTRRFPAHGDRDCGPMGVPAVGMGFNPTRPSTPCSPWLTVEPCWVPGWVPGGCPGSVPPHLKGYPNWTEMALISLVSPPHFTVTPVSPLKEPQAPKAKMAKSYGRGAARRGARGRGGGELETLGTPPPWGGMHPSGGLHPPALSHGGRGGAGRAAIPQLSALCASTGAAAGTGICVWG